MDAVRTSIFQTPSLETTAGGALRFAYMASHLPPNTLVNIAFIDAESAKERIVAIDVLRSSGLTPRPIVSARRFTSEGALRSFLYQAVQIKGVRDLFLVGGDPAVPRGPFRDSLDVINGSYLDETNISAIGIAGYPEGHPRIEGAILLDSLQRKVEALKAKGLHVEITTQLSFDALAVIAWIQRVRGIGIKAPIRIGIPSPAGVSGILKFAKLCRVRTSIELLQRYGWETTSLLNSAGPDRFLTELLESTERLELGPLSLHLYPLGNLEKALQWFNGWEEKSRWLH